MRPRTARNDHTSVKSAEVFNALSLGLRVTKVFIIPAGFKHKEGLTIHIKRHNGTLLKKFECNQCTIKFTTVHRLNQHALTHTGAKPHECTYCDRAYASKGDLVKHLQKVHVGHAVYRCEKCPLAFPRIVELREHLQVHVEEN